MLYEGTRKSRANGFTDVYTFTAGKEEIRLLHSICEEELLKMPKLFETSQIRARLRNMRNVLSIIKSLI